MALKRYNLYLNGQFYACGCIYYVSDLIREYTDVRGMYGHKSVEFRIEEARQ